jgi:hypothetical protein
VVFRQMAEMIYSGLNTGSVCQSDDLFFGSSGSASTPVEIIAKNGYFEKRSVLIRKKPAHLAGLQYSPFCGRVTGGSVRMEGHDGVFLEVMFENSREDLERATEGH